MSCLRCSGSEWLPPSRSSRASRLGTKLRGSGMQPITSAPAPPLLPNFHFHFHFCFQLKPLFDPHPAHTHISFHFHFRFQLRPIASLPNYPRQRCRLNICSYIGWIDKYCICQFNQYNYKYWDGSAVFVNSTNITTNIETAALSSFTLISSQFLLDFFYFFSEPDKESHF